MGLTLDMFEPQISVLGGLLLDPDSMGEACQTLTKEDFLSANCRIMWDSMSDLFRTGQKIDAVSVKNSLSGFDGAADLIVRCMENAAIGTSLTQHIAILKQQSQLSRLRDIGNMLAGCTDSSEALDLVSQAMSLTMSRQVRQRRNMADMLQSFGQRHAESVAPNYVPWPFQPLSDGVRVVGGKYLIIGGYPSDGKTAFALACAFSQAKSRRVKFYSLETDAETVEDRAAASIAGISMERIQDNRLTPEDWQRYAEAASSSDWDFEIVNAAGMTVDDIRADALATRADIIYIDYLQLIRPAKNGWNESRFNIVTQISMDLQQLAKTTGITVVALSQMTRPEANKKTGKIPEPTMHNLRESGQIEQDADVIMLLYREDQSDFRSPRKLNIAKNKERKTGRFWLAFDGEFQRFRCISDPLQQKYSSRLPHRKTPVLNEPLKSAQPEYSQIQLPDPNCPF